VEVTSAGPYANHLHLAPDKIDYYVTRQLGKRPVSLLTLSFNFEDIHMVHTPQSLA